MQPELQIGDAVSSYPIFSIPSLPKKGVKHQCYVFSWGYISRVFLNPGNMWRQRVTLERTETINPVGHLANHASSPRSPHPSATVTNYDVSANLRGPCPSSEAQSSRSMERASPPATLLLSDDSHCHIEMHKKQHMFSLRFTSLLPPDNMAQNRMKLCSKMETEFPPEEEAKLLQRIS